MAQLGLFVWIPCSLLAGVLGKPVPHNTEKLWGKGKKRAYFGRCLLFFSERHKIAILGYVMRS